MCPSGCLRLCVRPRPHPSLGPSPNLGSDVAPSYLTFPRVSSPKSPIAGAPCRRGLPTPAESARRTGRGGGGSRCAGAQPAPLQEGEREPRDAGDHGVGSLLPAPLPPRHLCTPAPTSPAVATIRPWDRVRAWRVRFGRPSPSSTPLFCRHLRFQALHGWECAWG